MYKLNDNVIYKIVREDKIVLIEMDNPSNTILEIEGASAGFFISLVKGEEVGSIIETMCSEYDTSKDQVVSDVDSFLKKLVERKILLKG